MTATTTCCGAARGTANRGICVPRIAAGTTPASGAAGLGSVSQGHWIESLPRSRLCGGGQGAGPAGQFPGHFIAASRPDPCPGPVRPYRPARSRKAGLAERVPGDCLRSPGSILPSRAACALGADLQSDDVSGRPIVGAANGRSQGGKNACSGWNSGSSPPAGSDAGGSAIRSEIRVGAIHGGAPLGTTMGSTGGYRVA